MHQNHLPNTSIEAVAPTRVSFLSTTLTLNEELVTLEVVRDRIAALPVPIPPFR